MSNIFGDDNNTEATLIDDLVDGSPSRNGELMVETPIRNIDLSESPTNDSSSTAKPVASAGKKLLLHTSPMKTSRWLKLAKGTKLQDRRERKINAGFHSLMKLQEK